MPSGQDSLALNRLNQQVNEALTEITVRLGRAGQFSELILSGSDMAPGIFRRLGASGLTLEPEQLGLEWPVASLIGPVPIRVMTKAAGVGQPDGLVRAFRALMSGDSER